MLLARTEEIDTLMIGEFSPLVNSLILAVKRTGRVCFHTSTPNAGHRKYMKKYLISYDLDKPGQDYHRLIKELERLGATRILYSEWIFRSTSSAAQIRDWLQSFIDGNDMLLVVALTGEAAWTGLMVNTDTFKEAIAA